MASKERRALEKWRNRVVRQTLALEETLTQALLHALGAQSATGRVC